MHSGEPPTEIDFSDDVNSEQWNSTLLDQGFDKGSVFENCDDHVAYYSDFDGIQSQHERGFRQDPSQGSPCAITVYFPDANDFSKIQVLYENPANTGYIELEVNDELVSLASARQQQQNYTGLRPNLERFQKLKFTGHDGAAIGHRMSIKLWSSPYNVRKLHQYDFRPRVNNRPSRCSVPKSSRTQSPRACA